MKLNPVRRGPCPPDISIYLGQLGKHFGQVLLDGNVHGVIPEVLEMADDMTPSGLPKESKFMVEGPRG